MTEEKSEVEIKQELAKAMIRLEANNFGKKQNGNILTTRLVRTPNGALPEYVVNRELDQVSLKKLILIVILVGGILLVLRSLGINISRLENTIAAAIIIGLVIYFITKVIYVMIKSYFETKRFLNDEQKQNERVWWIK